MRPRNLPFDALAEVCSVTEGSPREKHVAQALKLIREQSPLTDVALAGEIRAQAARYRRVMPGAMLTPTALAKWWTDLPGLDRPRVTGWRFARGSHGGTWVEDPAGTDRPPAWAT